MESPGASEPVVVLLSGGLDSSTLVYHLQDNGFRPIGLSVVYGQKHEYELTASRAIAADAGIERETCYLGDALKPIFKGAKSSQVGQQLPVPVGHYADESMKLTIVPNRNMLLLAVAGALAVSREAKYVAFAPHAGDHPIYPDCRPEFAEVVSATLLMGAGIRLLTPFVKMTKTDIVRRGDALNVPFDFTYSCYEGRPVHCGKCGTCFERREAFREAGVVDPTKYEA